MLDCGYLNVITVILLTVAKPITCFEDSLDISLNSKQASALLDIPIYQDLVYYYKICADIYLPNEVSVELFTISSTSTPNEVLTIELRTTNTSNDLEITFRSLSGESYTEHRSFKADHINQLKFTFPWDVNQKLEIWKSLPTCEQVKSEHNASSRACGSVVLCQRDLDLPPTSLTLVRTKREVPASLTVAASNGTDNSTAENKGLSGGALAAAIVVPILVAALLAVGGYFLYRWLRSRRTEHGVYQPKEMENQGNFSKQPDPQNVIKVPPEERLI